MIHDRGLVRFSPSAYRKLNHPHLFIIEFCYIARPSQQQLSFCVPPTSFMYMKCSATSLFARCQHSVP